MRACKFCRKLANSDADEGGKKKKIYSSHKRCENMFKVKKFDSTSISQARIIFLIGRRNTGKSVLMRDLLYNMPRPDYVLAMAPTSDSIEMFKEFLPEACIFNYFSQDKLDSLIQLQKRLVASGRKRNIMLLLDDCLYQKGVLKSASMRHLFFNGRHDNISMLCAAQYLMEAT